MILHPPGKGVIGNHIEIGLDRAYKFEVAAGHQCSPFADPSHLFDQQFHVADRGGPGAVFGRRIVRDDVRCIAALCDDAMKTGIRGRLLSKRADTTVEQRERVESIDAIVKGSAAAWAGLP